MPQQTVSTLERWVQYRRGVLCARMVAGALGFVFQCGLSYLMALYLTAMGSQIVMALFFVDTVGILFFLTFFVTFLIWPLAFYWYSHPWIALSLWGVLVLWAVFRKWRQQWPLPQAYSTMEVSGSGGAFMNLQRQSHLGFGHAVSAFWGWIKTFHHRPVDRAVSLVRAVREWRTSFTPLPEGADAAMDALREAYRIRNWNEAVEFPEMLPMLEALLKQDLLRTRDARGVGVELKPSETFLKFLLKEEERLGALRAVQ